MMLGLIAITPKFVPLFFTNKFVSVIPIMMIESIVILFIAWSNAIGAQFLLPTKQTTAYTISVVIGAVINLIANIPLILKYGAIGAAAASVLSELSVTVYQLIVIRHQISYRRLFDDVFKCFFAGIIMFIEINYSSRLLSQNWSSIIVEIFLGIFVYIALLFIMKAKIISKAMASLKR